MNGMLFAGLLAAASLYTCPLHGQAMPTESKSGDLQIGAGASGVRPDYTNTNFYGPTIYATFDVRYHIGIEADVHLLSMNAPNSFGENTYEIGVRYNLRTRRTGDRINFYPKFMFGRGVFSNVFNTTVSGGTKYNLAYNEYSIGAGIEYKLRPHITIRVLDFESQHWMAFPTQGNTPSLDHGLSPYVATIGAAYHF